MNYLQNRTKKRKNITKGVGVILVLLVLIFFHKSVGKGLAWGAHGVFRPVILLGSSIGNGMENFVLYFSSKQKLARENETLNASLEENKATLSSYNTILDENTKLKETLNRAIEAPDMVLAGILSKPNKSVYDTLLIDAGDKHGIKVGDVVFAYGDVPIGRIDQVYDHSSNVVLYSSPGEKKEVVVTGKDVFLETVGRGGGNFEMNIPRDLELPVDTVVVLPGVHAYTLAKVTTIISDPRDSFVKALLASPINIWELKFVEVKR